MIEGSHQKNHRDVRKPLVFLYKFANFIPVFYRHEHVGQNQVGMHVRNPPDSSFTVAHGNDFDALILQGYPHHLLNIAVVVSNENRGHAPTSGLPMTVCGKTYPIDLRSILPGGQSTRTINACVLLKPWFAGYKNALRKLRY